MKISLNESRTPTYEDWRQCNTVAYGTVSRGETRELAETSITVSISIKTDVIKVNVAGANETEAYTEAVKRFGLQGSGLYQDVVVPSLDTAMRLCDEVLRYCGEFFGAEEKADWSVYNASLGE